MDELISRKEVIEIIKRVADGCSYVDIPTDELIQFIQRIQTIATCRDGLKGAAVRCGDCKYWQPITVAKGRRYGLCKNINTIFEFDLIAQSERGRCRWGRRKEE